MGHWEQIAKRNRARRAGRRITRLAAVAAATAAAALWVIVAWVVFR